jgi:hypothetical protein
MVMSFAWLPERVDPASWNPPPGAVAHVTATVDGEYSGPIRLASEPTLALAGQTPADRTVPPIRATLTRLLARWKEQTEASEASESRIPPAMIADLEEYLEGRISPRELTWSIHTPRQSGRYPLAVVAGDQATVRTSLVLGDRFPPEPKQDLGDGRGPLQVVHARQADSPVQRITVAYQSPRTLGDRVFFAPLAKVPFPTLQERAWTQWDMGWLLTYIAAYLLALLPLRWLLRIP